MNYLHNTSCTIKLALLNKIWTESCLPKEEFVNLYKAYCSFMAAGIIQPNDHYIHNVYLMVKDEEKFKCLSLSEVLDLARADETLRNFR